MTVWPAYIYGTTEILTHTTGVIDCGTSLISIATKAYNLYKAANSGEFNPVTQLLAISNDQYGALQELKFNIGPQTYTLTPNTQIWPHSLNARIGSHQADTIYLIVCDIGKPIGGGLDFISGYIFMQRFYIVYDATNSLVGFATASFTNATTN
ncbi:aspartic peptidase domain-containing protein [Suillus spraguei]|nr:aspartic peptidase domain-containing protein [Suillus spraguei]